MLYSFSQFAFDTVSLHCKPAFNMYQNCHRHRLVQMVNLWTKYLVITIVYLNLFDYQRHQIMAQNCPSMCTCLWKNNKQTALCVNQGLISIPSGISSSTQVLDLNKNNFQILPSKVFQERGLINLQKVFLGECKLGVIAPDAFSQLMHLIELYLSSNLLTAVPSEALKHCPLVRRLQLNNNPIQAIRENSFDSLSHLMSLDLSHCEIDLIEPGAFRGLIRLQFLKLDNNRLSTLSPLVVNDLPPLFSFDLHRNPWNCDCELRASREWMYKYNVPQSIPPTCKSPERLHGSMWNSLDIDDFACKPMILSRDVEVTTYPSMNTSFTCTVKAVPEPRVSWLVADTGSGNNSFTSLQTRNDKYFVSEDRSAFGYITSTLNILNVDTADAGLSFRCFAENQAGSATKKFNLTLIALPYTSFNGWSKAEIAGIVIGLLFAAIVLCVLIILCVIRRTRHYARNGDTVKANKQHLPAIDVLNSVKTSKNSNCDEKCITVGNGVSKIEMASGAMTTPGYAYTPDVTANTAGVDNSFNHSYDGLLQVSPQQHLQQTTHETTTYNNFENYDLYDYNNDALNYNYDTSFVSDMPLSSGQHIDPSYWSKARSQLHDSQQDLHQSSSGLHPSQHHVNVVGQGSYNIGHPTVVRYSPDEGYAEEPAIIPYNLQGTEV